MCTEVVRPGAAHAQGFDPFGEQLKKQAKLQNVHADCRTFKLLVSGSEGFEESAT